MSEKILTAESFSEAMKEVYKLIENREVDLDCRYILILPDKFTLDAETKLFENSMGAFDVEVLTFARLFYRLADAREYLAREGAVMLIRSICEDIELECYNKSARFVGFSEKVYETINSLIDKGIDIMSAIPLKRAAESKLNDIKKLYAEYILRSEGKFIDRNGRLALLAHTLESFLYKSVTLEDGSQRIDELEMGGIPLSRHYFYVANFMELTAPERRVIDALKKVSDVTVFEVGKGKLGDSNNTAYPAYGERPPIRAKSVEVYDCVGSINALKAAARRIRSMVATSDMRYRDVCIVTSSPAFDEAERIFTEYQIPFYTDHAFELSDNPLAAFLANVFDIYDRQYRRTHMIELSKNIHSGISKRDSDAFENFVNEYNIDYLAFKDAFDKNVMLGIKSDELDEDDTIELGDRVSKDKLIRFERAERVRSSLMKKLLHLEEEYKRANNAKSFSEFITKLLSVAEQVEGSEDIHISSAHDKICSILQLMEKVLQHQRRGYAFLRDVFLEGLKSGKIMAIPNLSDSVVIAVPSTFRGQEFKAVFVLGMNEGETPAPRPISGLFGGDEDAIAGYNQVGYNENVVEIDHILHAAKDKIFISYDSSCESGKSNYLKDFLETNEDIITLNSAAMEEEKLGSFLDILPIERNRLILEYCSSAASAIELYLGGVSAYRSTGRIPDFYAAVYAAVKEHGIDKFFEYADAADSIECDLIDFKGGYISVSRLQTYFSCPYSYFLKYVLRAKERKDGKLQAFDIGDILHKVVENFVKDDNLWLDIEKSTKKLIDDYLDKKAELKVKLKAEMYTRLCKEAGIICTILKSHLEGGDFESLGQEIKLETATFLRPLILGKGNTILTLKGAVDYADEYGSCALEADNESMMEANAEAVAEIAANASENASIACENAGEKGYARIIDYKTGRADFSFRDMYYGTKIQLPLYMQAFLKSGYRAAGFFLFPFKKKWDDDEKSHRLKGVFNRESEVVFALDRELIEGAESNIIAAKTKLNAKNQIKLFGRHYYAFSEEDIVRMCDYANSIANTAIEEIAGGYISPRPYDNSGGCACDYCNYFAICGNKMQNLRKQEKIEAKDITG